MQPSNLLDNFFQFFLSLKNNVFNIINSVFKIDPNLYFNNYILEFRRSLDLLIPGIFGRIYTGIFKDFSIEKTKSCFQFLECKIDIFITLLLLIFAFNLTFIGIRSSKAFTLFPIFTYIVYIGLSTYSYMFNESYLNSTINFIHNLCLNDNNPTFRTICLNYNIFIILLAMIITRIISSFYTILKYLVFSYLISILWAISVPNNPDTINYLIFFLITSIVIVTSLKMSYIVENLILSSIYSFLGSSIFILYLVLAGFYEEVIKFVQALLALKPNFKNRIELLWICVALIGFYIQFMWFTRKN